MRKHVLEKDAKDSLCPVTNSACIGSKCMMWSWTEIDPELERRKTDHKATANEVILQKKFIPVKGYCGW